MINAITLAGNLVEDPKLWDAGEGSKQRVTFRIMADGLTPQGKDAEGVDCILFGNFSPYVVESAHKGDKVTVQGRLEVQFDGQGNKRAGKFEYGEGKSFAVPMYRIVCNSVGGIELPQRPRGDAQSNGSGPAEAVTADAEATPF